MSVGDARPSDGAVINDTAEHTNALGIKNSAAVVLPTDTVCLSRTGSIGYSVRLGREMATSQGFVNWICGEYLLARYLQLLFLAENSFLHRISEGVAHTTIYFPEAKAFHISLPPIEEQRRIVEALETHFTRLDAAVAMLERVRANLKRYRAAVVGATLEGGVSGRTTPIELGVQPVGSALPIGWRWARWSEIGKSQNGRAFPSTEYGESGARLLRPGNLHVSGRVIWNEANTRCLPPKWAERYPGHVVGPNELVMNLTAQSLRDEFLGRICMTEEGPPSLLNQRLARLTPIGPDRRFMFWVFKGPRFRRFVDRLNKGSLIQHMFTSQLDEFVFPLPPSDEQRRIVATLDAGASRIERAQVLIDTSARHVTVLRRQLLRVAFEGRLVPQDPRDEPASVLLDRIRAARVAAPSAPKMRPARSRR